jgi:NAD(P)-dependent dehydrogenase (short-subunit alcohol dehydrogenase family)
MMVADFEITSRRSYSWRARNSCTQSCSTCAGQPPKAAVAVMVRGIAVDIAPRGITVNNIQPGRRSPT